MIRRSRTCAWWAMLCVVGLAGVVQAAPEYLDVKTTWQTVRGVRGIRVDLKGDTEPLVEPNGQPLFTKTACTTEHDLVPVKGGFDLVLRLKNPTATPQERPAFWLRGVRIARSFTYLDARSLGHIHERTVKRGQPIFWYGMTYPDDLYAPVVMMHNERFAIGVSLIYDMVKAKHHIRGQCYTEGGTYFGTSGLGFNLQVPTPAWRKPSGRLLLEPGATQEYRFAVRFSKPDRWLDTLEPYREFFRKTYGGVKYKADRRPVFGEPTGLVKFIDPKTNPRGFNPKTRLDLVGWKPYVHHLMAAVETGYRRVMVWCPSGLYQKGDNYPPEFMTEWPAKLVETLGEFKRLKDRDVTVGFWWGRASQVSGGWNSNKMWARDIRNPKDLAAGDAELRLAAERGADEVGLDAVQAIPAWDRYVWLPRIQKMFPTMRFITESSDCDVLHTMAPTFMTYQRQNQPPVLADWLNPGHESWIMLRWQECNQENFDRITGWHCVPVTMSIPVKHTAADFRGP